MQHVTETVTCLLTSAALSFPVNNTIRMMEAEPMILLGEGGREGGGREVEREGGEAGK